MITRNNGLSHSVRWTRFKHLKTRKLIPCSSSLQVGEYFVRGQQTLATIWDFFKVTPVYSLIFVNQFCETLVAILIPMKCRVTSENNNTRHLFHASQGWWSGISIFVRKWIPGLFQPNEILTLLSAVSLFAIFQSHYLYVTSSPVNTSVVTKLKWSLIWRWTMSYLFMTYHSLF